MKMQLEYIINQLRSEGKDYTQFKTLLTTIKASGINISKDEILEFVANDYRIQLHTTPNSIAKLISHLSKIYHPKSAVDICCGTGNILYYLQNEIDDLTGVEIIDNVAELTKYFIPDLQIITADSFKYPFTRKFDLVVGNIPFGMRIEIDGKSIPGEEAFLRKAHELLSDNGKAIMLLPYSILVSENFRNFRNEFVNFLEEVISLPTGNIRDTHIKTALIILNKHEPNEIKFTQLKDFENLHQEYEKFNHRIYDRNQLIERWDPNYHLLKENIFYKELDNFQTKELHELAEIIRGKMIQNDSLKLAGDFLYLKPFHIKNNHLNLESGLKYINKDFLSDKDYRYILQPGDIVISTIFNDFKIYVYQTGDEPAIASNNLAIIRSAKQDYILSYLQTEDGKRIFKTQAEDLKTGIVSPYLNIKDLASIKIPILPVADLNELSNKAIEKSTEANLLNQLEFIKSLGNITFNEIDKMQVCEPHALYFNNNSSTLFLNFLNDRFKRIEDQLHLVHKKLDILLDIIRDLKNDFLEIQKFPREEEEKLFKLYQKIDVKLDTLYNKENQTIEGYVDEVKRWLDLWELLDLQSQKFLPIAEFIFDELSKLEEPDYAPFVVQYCRTLENEILKKLFETYQKNGLTNINRDELVKDDLANQKTGKFALMVKRNKVTYTLGDMNFIMALLKQGGNILNDSPLLKHFRAFTISYFDEKIVETEFLNNINKLTTDYRNKAAHPFSISIELAKECQSLLRKSLNMFLESVKNKEL